MASAMISSRSQTFLDAFMSDARLVITSFMQLDEFANLALVCKTTAGVVSGRTINKDERQRIFARFVVDPMLATLRPLPPPQRFFYGHDETKQMEHDAKRAAEKAEFDAKYEAWSKLGPYERIQNWRDFNTPLSTTTTHDYYETLHALTYGSFYKRHDGTTEGHAVRPLVEFMNQPITSNGMVIRESYDSKPSHVTHGSVIVRAMWYLKRYPSWVQFLLTTPAADRVRDILATIHRNIQAMSRDAFHRNSPNNFYTPLMPPPGMVCKQFCTSKGKFVTNSTKNMNKKHWDEFLAISNHVYSLHKMYEQFHHQRVSQFEADMLIPKIMATRRGDGVLSSQDLDLILQVLQRNRPSKRRRQDDGVDDVDVDDEMLD
jgi:hypothetical protein